MAVQMVVTLRNGAQIRADVKKFSTEREGNSLSNVIWTTEDRPETVLNWVDLGEVVAVHAENVQE